MGSWIYSNLDFGVPCIEYVVGMRELEALVGLRIQATGPTENTRLVLQDLVEKIRPNLKGCFVWHLRTTGGMRLSIGVFHPSLPKKQMHQSSESFLLYPCHLCGKDIQADAMVYLVGGPENPGYACSGGECSSEVFGVPRMQPVINRLLDLQRLKGDPKPEIVQR